MNLTISLRKFLESVASSSGLTYDTCESLLGELTAYITSTLAHGENVYLKGIGSFRMIDEEVEFAPDPVLAENINQPFAAFEAVELPDEVTDAMLDNTDDSESDKTQETDDSATAEVVTPPPFFPPLPDEYAHTGTTAQPDTITAERPSDNDTPAPDNETAMRDIPIMPPLPKAEATDNTYVAPSEEASDEPEMQQDRTPKKLIIAAFIAGMVCFLAGYALGHWTGTSDSTVTDAAEDVEVSVKENADTLYEPDTIAAPVIPEVSHSEPQETTEVQTAVTDESANTAKTDTIGRNRFLTTMARKHYGQMEFWVYIYEENVSRLGNPNKLEAGTVVVIPPAAKYGIDASDPESVARAKEKAKEIEARFAK